MTIHARTLDLWMETVRSLTVTQAANVLAKLHQGYSQEYVSIYQGTNCLEGSFAWLAVYELKYIHSWYTITCKFAGGPNGASEFVGTLGAFVTDRFMREATAGRESLIWDAYRKVHDSSDVGQT